MEDSWERLMSDYIYTGQVLSDHLPMDHMPTDHLPTDHQPYSMRWSDPIYEQDDAHISPDPHYDFYRYRSTSPDGGPDHLGQLPVIPMTPINDIHDRVLARIPMGKQICAKYELASNGYSVINDITPMRQPPRYTGTVDAVPGAVPDAIQGVPPLPRLGSGQVSRQVSRQVSGFSTTAALFPRFTFKTTNKRSTNSKYHPLDVLTNQFTDYVSGFDFSEFEKKLMHYISDFMNYYRTHYMKCDFQYCFTFNKPAYRNLANIKQQITKNWAICEYDFMQAITSLIWLLDLHTLLLPNKETPVAYVDQLKALYQLHHQQMSNDMMSILDMKRSNNLGVLRCRQLLSGIFVKCDNSVISTTVDLFDLALSLKIGKFPAHFTKTIVKHGKITRNNHDIPISGPVVVYTHEPDKGISRDDMSKKMVVTGMADGSDNNFAHYNIRFFSTKIVDLQCLLSLAKNIVYQC